jgi:tetrathionate reductase subunit B
MVTDLRKCVGCQACTAACNAEWDVPAGYARTRVRPTAVAGTFPNLTSTVYVAQCNHCDHPPCVEACPSGATSQGTDGIVQIDKALCIGCGFCVDACPYDARHIDPATRKADKCDFCASRLARGEGPACVATCTAHAKYFGDLEDRGSDVFRMVYEAGAQRMEIRTVAVGPNVYYLGRREHLDLVLAGFPPHAPRLPNAGEAWSRVVKPLVLAAVGATFVGQAVAFFIQLRKGEQDFED